jgi:hypothetical protein
MPSTYPWYELVDGITLEQGDLLLNCPNIVLPADLAVPVPPEIKGRIDQFDVIVMTQSCDLVHDKTTEVLLCPHWDIRKAQELNKELEKAGALVAITKGRLPRYTMLAESNIPEVEMGKRIADFGRVFSLSKALLTKIAESQGRRLRLCPPYREHLSQSFARFFMRVGLPQEIKLP